MQPSTTPQQQMAQMLNGYWFTQPIYVAVKLGIPDLLAAGPLPIETIAQRTETDAESLYRLLRALASMAIFVEHDDREFSLTPMADCLRRDAPNSQRATALLVGEEYYRAWGELLYSVRTGKCAFDKVYGQPFFEFLAENPRQEQIFDEAMNGQYGRETKPLLDAYDFSQFETLVDIGGGKGGVLTAILREYPNLQGTLFDRPEVIEQARETIGASDVADRCKLVAGDFFEEVPTGVDAYMMRHVIHDWDDERAVRLLSNCRTAAGKASRLLVVDGVIPPGNTPFYGKMLDLTMLVVPGGQERTAAQFESLLSASGFRLRGIIATAAEISIVEGEPK